MIEEILKSSDFTDTLRSIAQKRRQGILELNNENNSSRIYFVAGRIVDFDSPDCNSAHALLQRMQSAGLLSGSDHPLVTNYDDLFEYLQTLPEPLLSDNENFKFLVEEQILDSIYKLQVGAPDSYYFTARIVANVGQFNPRISVGQYLLDLVALGELRSTLSSLISNNGKYELRSKALPDMAVLKFLFQAFSRASILSDLEQNSALCTFHFLESMQNLLAEGIVVEIDRQGDVPLAEEEETLVPVKIQEEHSVSKESDIDDEEWLVVGVAAKVPSQIEAAIDQVQPVLKEPVPPAKSTISNITPVKAPVQAALKPNKVTSWKTVNARLLQSNIVVTTSLWLFFIGTVVITALRWSSFFKPFTEL